MRANTDSSVDSEKQPSMTERLDIEHVAVTDDPRQWSHGRKNVVLAIVSAASMIAGLAANIQNPSIADMETSLRASSSQISWSISLFILVQGNAPLIWSAICEIKGRKKVYVVSISIFAVGSVVVATSKTIGLVIGFRCMQAAGSSAVLALGAATLADIYDPVERGRKMGIYYVAPLLGPSIGPIFGGILTTGFNWRAPFWFLVIFSGLSCLSFVFLFKDTFRRERSITYQAALRWKSRERVIEPPKDSSQPVAAMPLTINPLSDDGKNGTFAQLNEVKDNGDGVPASGGLPLNEVKLSLIDVNPFKPWLYVLRRWNNAVILFASGLLFAFSFNITYTSSRTLGSAYHYNPLRIGFVLLSFGLGSIGGSVLGGRWSDRVLARLKAENGGKFIPEMRLRSTVWGMWLLPPSIIGFAWCSEKHVHISALCVMLFLCGFFSIWIYASTLAYIVDANNGRSSTAVATNSSFRGLCAFVTTEVAVPLQDTLGDGWMYTIWAALMIISQLLILLVMFKGRRWREAGEVRERRKADKADS